MRFREIRVDATRKCAGQKGTWPRRVSGRWALLLSSLVLGAGLTSCGQSSTVTSPKPGSASDAQVADVPTPAADAATVTSPTLVQGLPSESAIISASVDGTTGWVLTRGQEAGIWRVPSEGSPEQVVAASRYANLDGGGVSIVAVDHGVVLLGQRCVYDSSAGAECVKSDGIAQYFDAKGSLTKTTTLWKDVNAQAGGSPPVLLSVSGSDLWLDGIDHSYELDATGVVVASVPKEPGTNVCGVGGALYALQWGSGNATAPSGSSGVPSGAPSLIEWSGKDWTAVPDSKASEDGGFPAYSCGAAGVMLWDGGKLSQTWTPSDGWKSLPGSAATVPAAKSNAGVGYVLATSGDLARENPRTGVLTDLGLDLESKTPGAGAPPLVVAERRDSVFACTYTFIGIQSPSSEQAVHCGFAALSD